MKKYYDLLIKTYPFVEDEFITSKLWELNPDGIFEDDIKEAYHLYFSSKPNETEIKNLLDDLRINNYIAGCETSLNEFEEKNWNEEWEKNLRVIEVTDKIVIKPSYKEYNAKEDQIVLVIDPKMSFGTGEHATTQMMLKLIEKYIQPNDKVIDVGTGTGILAIAAIKLGAKFALALDNDEWVYENIIENLHNNNVSEKQCSVFIGTSDKIKDNDFDLLIANIQKNVLLELADDFRNKLLNATNKPARILLSGILSIDEKDIIKEYSNQNFKHIETIYQDEWCAIALQLNI